MIKKKISIIIAFLLLTQVFLTCENTPPFEGKDIMSLPPMKDTIGVHFGLVGNIFNPGDVSGNAIANARLTRHYNILTHENHMKPFYLVSSISGSTVTLNAGGINTAKNMVDAARAANIKVVGHTLLWHSQNPTINLSGLTKDQAIAVMKDYIKKIVEHEAFKGKIYSWDVLNEAFPDGLSGSPNWKTSMRNNNPWYAAIGYEFVYEGFLAARLADPEAILYYNDYNTDNPTRARLIRDMVQEVNNTYAQFFGGTRKLIEGIGMQEHHNTNVQASAVSATINLFRPLGVRLSVSELDVLAQGYSAAVDKKGPPASGNDLSLQARRYGE